MLKINRKEKQPKHTHIFLIIMTPLIKKHWLLEEPYYVRNKPTRIIDSLRREEKKTE
jgi:hypothetical protein